MRPCQNTDLLDLQRLLNRSASPLSGGEQQNLTRWAVWQAAALLRAHAPAFDRLREALAQRKGTVECIRALEGAA